MTSGLHFGTTVKQRNETKTNTFKNESNIWNQTWVTTTVQNDRRQNSMSYPSRVRLTQTKCVHFFQFGHLFDPKKCKKWWIRQITLCSGICLAKFKSRVGSQLAFVEWWSSLDWKPNEYSKVIQKYPLIYTFDSDNKKHWGGYVPGEMLKTVISLHLTTSEHHYPNRKSKLFAHF